MTAREVNRLIMTITFCFVVILWGSVIIFRTIPDANYHALPATEQQNRVDTYKDCIAAPATSDDACRAITGAK